MTKIKEIKRLKEVGVVEQMAIWGFPEPGSYSETFGRSKENTEKLENTIHDRAPSWANTFYRLGFEEMDPHPHRIKILYLKMRN